MSCVFVRVVVCIVCSALQLSSEPPSLCLLRCICLMFEFLSNREGYSSCRNNACNSEFIAIQTLTTQRLNPNRKEIALLTSLMYRSFVLALLGARTAPCSRVYGLAFACLSRPWLNRPWPSLNSGLPRESSWLTFITYWRPCDAFAGCASTRWRHCIHCSSRPHLSWMQPSSNFWASLND